MTFLKIGSYTVMWIRMHANSLNNEFYSDERLEFYFRSIISLCSNDIRPFALLYYGTVCTAVFSILKN